MSEPPLGADPLAGTPNAVSGIAAEFLAFWCFPPVDYISWGRMLGALPNASERKRRESAMSGLKNKVAAIGAGSGLSRIGLAWQKRTRMPFIRALNYHDVPATEADVFEAQLAYFARHFEPVDLDGLLSLAAGDWPHQRPGLILSFDDGLATHAHVAAPLLEKYGFVGWFMVPTGFVDTPPSEQAAFARSHSIVPRAPALPDGRLAITWDELRRLSQRHVIGCHTINHVRFSDVVGAGTLEHETSHARSRFAKEIDGGVDVFAWVGGEESSYSAAGAAAIRQAGFHVALMTNNAVFRPGDDLMKVQRTNVETTYDPALTQLHLSGFYDILYGPKRHRLDAKLSIA